MGAAHTDRVSHSCYIVDRSVTTLRANWPVLHWAIAAKAGLRRTQTKGNQL
jgi:hypothetical protein